MEGNIYITGLIGSMPLEVGVELIDVIQQVKKQPQATSFTVHINSEGGVVDTGFDIYNYLRSLQLPIKTVGSGLVASIATVIFMAGDTRILREGTQFMIHLPMGGAEGTADQVEAYANEIRNAEKKLIDFYKKATNTTDEAIRPLLVNETWLTNDQAINLGFATIENLPMVAVAYFKSNSTINTNKMTKEDKSFIENLFAPVLALIKKPIVNITVTDADGIVIDFAELVEGDIPKVDDVATIDGNPADGEFLMPDGSAIVFAAGVVVEVKEAAAEGADGSEDMQALKDENARLQQELLTANASNEANELAVANLEKEVVNIKKQITSKLDVESKKEPAKVVEVSNKRTFLKQ
jgi:ATP-dependent Clp protease protease subunit